MRFTGVSSVRGWVVRLTIGSFAIAALMGIVALLVPRHFGSVQGRILLSTLAVGVTSVLTLCYLLASESRDRWLGVVGGVAAVVAGASFLDMIWIHWQHDPGPALLRTFGVTGIVALTAAQFCLLRTVARRDGGVVARLLHATLAAGTGLAGLLIAAVLGWNPDEGAARLIGVIAILDVLGTVVTVALGVFGGGRHQRVRALTVAVPEPLAARLRARAEATGQDPESLVVEALTQYVESVEQV